MKVINLTKKTTIAENITIPTSFMDQSLGLLIYKTPIAMLLKTHFGIHTFGMHYPIDVLILDKQNLVVAMKERLRPNRIFLWNPKFQFIIELPSGTIGETKTQYKDKIMFE